MSPFRKLLWPGAATIAALAILLSLGFWQLQRRAEKAQVLAALDLAASTAPRALDGAAVATLRVLPPGSQPVTADALAELTRVRVEGVFLPARSIPVRGTLPATKGSPISGIGFFWMTPLQVPNGGFVFVNRGFVTSGGDWKAPAIPTPEGPQAVTGLIRIAEKPRPFTPADDPARGEYFSRDPAAMARAIGLPPAQVAPFFIDAERTPGSLAPPVGVDAREMIARIPNNHLQYAVTWFAFAATLIGVFGFFARARLRDEP